ncbi:MAG TPA: hypothetical protein VM370_01405, partial [Candidatus Thermoplasmatota archaeon]|nr:hypothetical protein [Candidatus Thermoplasmatota archaeon]
MPVAPGPVPAQAPAHAQAHAPAPGAPQARPLGVTIIGVVILVVSGLWAAGALFGILFVMIGASWGIAFAQAAIPWLAAFGTLIAMFAIVALLFVAAMAA